MIQAILIDDEKNNRAALRKKIETHCPTITIVAECTNGVEGIAAITQHNPNVIFLDIEMPIMNGFTMLEALPKKDFEIIFTTAYNQYAINAIRFGAFDYLVKPVDVAELIAVVNKLSFKSKTQNTERLSILSNQLQKKENSIPQKIAIATHQGLEIISTDSILYLEAIGNYTQIHFVEGKPLTASKTLKEFEDLLQNIGFFRIHNASLINVSCVKKYIKGDGGQIQLTNNIVLDVARRRKEELLLLLANIATRV
jgi:two-component system, LytTR family, response regulator